MKNACRMLRSGRDGKIHAKHILIDDGMGKNKHGCEIFHNNNHDVPRSM